MTKESISTHLRTTYARFKRQVNLGESEYVLEHLFGIANIKVLVAEQFEDVYRNFYLTKKIDISKRELFSYSDIYDFINSLLKIDMDDLIIFFNNNEILEYTLSLMNVLNRAFNFWIQNKKSGFRKGTKIFLEMNSSGQIILFLKPEIKT